MRPLLGALFSLPSLSFAAAVSRFERPHIPVVKTRHVYLIGDNIPIVVSRQAHLRNYKFEWIPINGTSIVSEFCKGTGRARDVQALAPGLPSTSMLTKKGVYYLSENSIPRG